MGNPSEFHMFIEEKLAKKSFNIALNIAKKHGELRKSNQYEYQIDRKLRTYYLKLKFKIFLEMTSMKMKAKEPTIYLVSVARLSKEDEIDFYDLCFDLSSSIDPLFSIGGTGIGFENYGPAWEFVEHYRNPYFFCLEPRLSISEWYSKNFLYNENLIRKAAEISKVLPKNELLNLLRKHCKKVAIGQRGGVSVLKGYNDYDSILLRLYLAREIRKRGVQLEKGKAESYAELLEI